MLSIWYIYSVNDVIIIVINYNFLYMLQFK